MWGLAGFVTVVVGDRGSGEGLGHVYILRRGMRRGWVFVPEAWLMWLLCVVGLEEGHRLGARYWGGRQGVASVLSCGGSRREGVGFGFVLVRRVSLLGAVGLLWRGGQERTFCGSCTLDMWGLACLWACQW